MRAFWRRPSDVDRCEWTVGPGGPRCVRWRRHKGLCRTELVDGNGYVLKESRYYGINFPDVTSR